MTFEQKFLYVLRSGETVLRQFCAQPGSLKATIDIMRTIIEQRLHADNCECAKAVVASALLRFRELYPTDTESKFAIINSLCTQIVEVSQSVSEESDLDREFLRANFGRRMSPLSELMWSTVECVHPVWSASIKKKNLASKWKQAIKIIASIAFWPAALILLIKDLLFKRHK